MKGTGTLTDPYVIMTAEDLYSMETLGGADVHCRLGADIDFNGTPYAADFVPIPVNWSSFDGDGHKIRNIHISDPTNRVHALRVMVAGEISITGLFLENAVISGSVVTLFMADSGIYSTIKLWDCSFMLKVSHTSSSIIAGEGCLLHGSGLTITAELCVISVSLIYNRGYAVFNGDTIRKSQIIIDITIYNAGDTSVHETSLFRDSTVSDSWITGVINCITSNGAAGSYHMTDFNCRFANSYQAVEMKNLFAVYWSNTFSSVCFYNNDLMCGAEYRSRESMSNKFYGLTTEQCKDPEYLTSIGFICGDERNGI